MRKFKKTVLSKSVVFFITLALVFTMLPVWSIAESNVYVQDISELTGQESVTFESVGQMALVGKAKSETNIAIRMRVTPDAEQKEIAFFMSNPCNIVSSSVMNTGFRITLRKSDALIYAGNTILEYIYPWSMPTEEFLLEIGTYDTNDGQCVYFEVNGERYSAEYTTNDVLLGKYLQIYCPGKATLATTDIWLQDFNADFDIDNSGITYSADTYALPTFETIETGVDLGTGLRVNWAPTETQPAHLHRLESEEIGSDIAENADEYAYLRIWVNNPTFIPLSLATRLFSDSTTVYMNANDAIVTRKDGTVITHDTSEQGGYGTNSSIIIPSAFSGWVAYPIDLDSITPASGSAESLNDFTEVNSIEFDIRRSETYDTDTYYILDNICLSINAVGKIQEEGENDFGILDDTPIETDLKNVIVLVGDGMGQTTLQATRDYKGSALYMDGMQYSSTTISSNNVFNELTDSSAGGTALSCGVRTMNGYTAMDIEGNAVENMVEFFSRAGKKSGIVTTSYLLDATPTAFGSRGMRNSYATLAEGLFENNISVLLGGGTNYFNTNIAYEGQNYTLLEYAQSVYNYTYVDDAESLQSYEGEKVLGVFGTNYMSYEMDRDDTQMSISDMTKKAISLLENEENGFFLMVEGGNIDHAEHNNDLTRTVTDTIAFDEAVKVALDYMKDNPDTLVVVCADHSTGGLVAEGTGYRFTTGNHDMSLTACYASGLGAEYFTNLTENAHISQAIRTAVLEVTYTADRVDTWKQDNVGWWYQRADGTYPANCWEKIDNIWYYFNTSGYMVTGWQSIGGTWYYFNGSGAMVANQWVGNYYLKDTGIMAKNEIVDDIYVGSDGAKFTGWMLQPEGYYYYQEGVKVTGWVNSGSTWYYMNPETGIMLANEWLDDTYYLTASGAMATGWLALDGTWYYLNAGGAKVTSSWVGNYYMDAQGHMATNAWVDNGRYYVDASGAYVSTSGWFWLNGEYYYLSGGLKQTGWILEGSTWYYMDPETGVMLANEWLNDTYYMTTSGAMATGWLQIDGNWYYFLENGAMASNQWIGSYYIGSDGIWVA